MMVSSGWVLESNIEQPVLVNNSGGRSIDRAVGCERHSNAAASAHAVDTTPCTLSGVHLFDFNQARSKKRPQPICQWC
jgi:hypothetical protein